MSKFWKDISSQRRDLILTFDRGRNDILCFYLCSSQENKADVKAIMARFQASGSSTDDSSSTPPGQSKQPLFPALSSGPPVLQAKKPVLESLSSSAIIIPPKPTTLKNTVSAKSDTEAQDTNKMKALVSKFANAQDDDKVKNKPSNVNRAQIPLKTVHKAPLHQPPINPSPTLLKPAGGSKPGWVKEDSGGGGGSVPPIPQKPNSTIMKLWQHSGEMPPANSEAANKPLPPTNISFKPPSHFRAAQNIFTEKAEPSDSAKKLDKKPPLSATNSIPPPRPTSRKPSLMVQSKPPPLHSSSSNGDSTLGPKRVPLPSSLALVAAPAKPNRPPKVNLEKFKRAADTSNGELVSCNTSLKYMIRHTEVLSTCFA